METLLWIFRHPLWAFRWYVVRYDPSTHKKRLS